MANIIEITTFDAPELDVFARLTQAQLRNRLEPEKGSSTGPSPCCGPGNVSLEHFRWL